MRTERVPRSGRIKIAVPMDVSAEADDGDVVLQIDSRSVKMHPDQANLIADSGMAELGEGDEPALNMTWKIRREHIRLVGLFVVVKFCDGAVCRFHKTDFVHVASMLHVAARDALLNRALAGVVRPWRS